MKGSNEFDAIIQAKTAELHFVLHEKLVRVYLEDAEIQRLAQDVDVFLINNNELAIPIPSDSDSTWRRKSRS